MLQLTRASLVCTESCEALATMRRDFDAHHAIRLPRFLHPHLLAYIQACVRAAAFREHDDGIAREACMADNAMLGMMWLIMNDPRLFEIVHRVTGCGPIHFFGGRAYALRADAGHYDQWHSDASDDRLVGISINLTDAPFQGGVFELRRADAGSPHWCAANTGPGDAMLFRIHDDLRHRVTPVVGDAARVAYAGWFQRGEDLLTFLKSAQSTGDRAGSLKYTEPSAG